MITKLYRLQMRESWHSVRLIYTLMLFISLMTVLLSFLRITFLTDISSSFSIMALIIATVIVIVQTVVNDYHNFQGKRAYFFRAIPAKSSDFLIARFFYYLSYILTTLILALLLLLSVQELIGGDVFRTIAGLFDFFVLSNIIGKLIFAYMLIRIPLSIIIIIFAITVGSEARLHRLGAGGPVLIYIIYYFAAQLLNLAAILLIPLSLKIHTNPLSGEFLYAELTADNMLAYLSQSFSEGFAADYTIIGIGFIITELLLYCLMAVWAYRSFDRKFSLRA